MAIDFPDSPSENDIYTVNGKRWIYSSGKWSIYGTTAPDATASDTEPSGVGDGHIWYRSDQSQTLIRYDNTWVEVGSAGGFDNASTNFPTSLDSATGFAAVEALQAKVGVDSSAVTSSLDYKVAQLEAISHGKILQVVSTTKTDTFTASVAAGGDVAVTGLSLNITPSSTSSKILLVANLTGAFQYERFGFSFDRGGTRLSQGDTAGSRTVATAAGSHDTAAVTVANVSGLYLDSPASTSSLTYSIYLHCFATATSSVYLNQTITDTDSASYLRATSSITALEVAA